MTVDESGSGDLMHYDTIILGAGISGLACASRLLKEIGRRANRLRVLEARDRIGGRIESVHVQGCRLDTGANWIHGTGNADRRNPLMDILPHKRHRPLNGSVLFQAPSGGHDVVGIHGEIDGGYHLDRRAHLAAPALAIAASGSSIPADAARLIISSVQKAIGEVQDLAATTPAHEAKHMSVLRELCVTKAFQQAFEVVPSEYHRTLGALFQSIESMEASPLLAQTTEPRRPESRSGVGLLEYAVDDYDGDQAFLQDGYVEIVDEIAKPLIASGAIKLGTIVKRIDWTSNPITIETSRGTYTAREVVCTFPLGVLKDCDKDALFVPTLTIDKQDAIQRLGFGTLDKVFAVYSTPWWTDEPYDSVIRRGLTHMETENEDESPDSFLGFTAELSGICIDINGAVLPDVYRLPIINLHNLTGQPVLGAFVSCKTATTVEAMKDEDIGALFHRTLTQWFGCEPPRPDAVYVTRWAQDPYSRGAYSHMTTGLSEARHKESLQEPIINEAGGVLRFAGEHCSRDHFAMVHGALLDGWRVADAMSQKSH